MYAAVRNAGNTLLASQTIILFHHFTISRHVPHGRP
jgi:hypothetical protein